MTCTQLLHCLGNNVKEKSQYLFSTDAIMLFFPRIFSIYTWLNPQMQNLQMKSAGCVKNKTIISLVNFQWAGEKAQKFRKSQGVSPQVAWAGTRSPPLSSTSLHWSGRPGPYAQQKA